MSLLDDARALSKAAPPCTLAKQVLSLSEARQQEVVELLLSEVGNRPISVVLHQNGFDLAETTIRTKRLGRCKCEWCQENLG